MNIPHENKNIEEYDQLMPSTSSNRIPKGQKNIYAWINFTAKITYPVSIPPGKFSNSNGIRFPIQYFKDIFDNELLNTNKPLWVTKDEIGQFLGM